MRDEGASSWGSGRRGGDESGGQLARDAEGTDASQVLADGTVPPGEVALALARGGLVGISAEADVVHLAPVRDELLEAIGGADIGGDARQEVARVALAFADLQQQQGGSALQH